jgi:hypothetical protein
MVENISFPGFTGTIDFSAGRKEIPEYGIGTVTKNKINIFFFIEEFIF